MRRSDDDPPLDGLAIALLSLGAWLLALAAAFIVAWVGATVVVWL
jgi:hypothetical protein